ncbi:hypothetical protein ACHAW5_006262 [Stephanodiscus triporus]|uniref:Uncharacterized protein n=1 Tax=Stephanodiscus triporus TaxID=2934178 RepID=A0ABD3MLV0_9STRA
MASKLAHLRSALQELQSCELPANSCRIAIDKENVPNDNAIANANENENKDDGLGGRHDVEGHPELLRRYKTARNAYLQKKTIESFISSLCRYDPNTNTFPLPDDDAEARAELARRQDEVLGEVKDTMDKVGRGVEEVRMKWEQFCAKREELSQIVEGMERAERNRRLLGGEENEFEEMDVEDDGEEITEDDVALQEEKLNELQQNKIKLENRLRSVRAQILDLEDDCHRTKRVVNEVRVKGGRQPLDWRGLTGHGPESTREAGAIAGGNDDEEGDVKFIAAIAQQVESEIAEVEEKASELKKSCEFYDGIRELMDELGGIKILSSKSISSASSSSSSSEASNGVIDSPEKRQKLANEDGFILTLMLLGRHILEITLSTSQTDKDGLRVSDAKITTPTTFPMPEALGNGTNANNNEETASLMETLHSISLSNQSFSKIMSQKQSLEITLPALDDLVAWSHSLESSSHGIRFILVETMARIRTLEARVIELSKLRERYAAQVYDVEASSAQGSNKYGGAEQEVVCAINEGITVALRLGSDCPLVPGSVYINEIFGVGGWDEVKLNVLRDVISKSRCRGPVEVMKRLTVEIRRRSKEEGWVVPATPALPRGKR